MLTTPLEIGAGLPADAQPRRLLRRTAPAIALLGVLVAVVLLAPGLGPARQLLDHASPGWIALAIALEALSCWSYVVGFRPVFCERMSMRTAAEISWIELGIGSIVPASGAGGLALGAWILRRDGMPRDEVVHRSVAFFVLKSLTNFLAVVAVGLLFVIGLLGPHQPAWRTLLPAGLAAATILGVVAIGRRARPAAPAPGIARVTRWWNVARRSLAGSLQTARRLVTDPSVIVGNVGYWAFDNAVLWATFHAVGASPPIGILLLGYLIGQLGGVLPLPGGIGGIDGGLIGALVVYGAGATVTVAAVIAYRLILFWLPLIGGAIALVSLRRGLNDPDRPDICAAPAVVT